VSTTWNGTDLFLKRSNSELVPPYYRTLFFWTVLSITPITPGEIPDLHALILELAQFERLEHEVEATPELLRHALFSNPPLAGALIGRVDDAIAGYALYYFTFCSFAARQGIWLDDLYVRPAFRHQGLGDALIRAVARLGAERQCGRFEWIALDWNQNALGFYRKLGARTLEEWVLLRMNSEELQRLASTS